MPPRCSLRRALRPRGESVQLPDGGLDLWRDPARSARARRDESFQEAGPTSPSTHGAVDTRREPTRAESLVSISGALESAPGRSGACCAARTLAARARWQTRLKSNARSGASPRSQLQDAYFGIGLYHYYAAVAPTAAKIAVAAAPAGREPGAGTQGDVAARGAGASCSKRGGLPTAPRVSVVREADAQGAGGS
jgi:hypothetical protein